MFGHTVPLASPLAQALRLTRILTQPDTSPPLQREYTQNIIRIVNPVDATPPQNLDIRRIPKHTAIIGLSGSTFSPGSIKGTRLPDSTTSRVSLTLPSSLESVDTIEHAAQGFAARAGFDEDTVPNIAMAVREAAVNAILHGNAYNPAKQITASFEANSDALVVRIADQGTGFDPGNIPDPLAPENILRGSGRGIFLIRAFMDEVHFRQLHPGTELTLIKHRTPAQPAA
jgi:serine/threonine-protein kinase RsbW